MSDVYRKVRKARRTIEAIKAEPRNQGREASKEARRAARKIEREARASVPGAATLRTESSAGAYTRPFRG